VARYSNYRTNNENEEEAKTKKSFQRRLLKTWAPGKKYLSIDCVPEEWPTVISAAERRNSGGALV
jgi:hypothetical protein